MDLAETHSYILQILREEIPEEFDQKLYSYFGFDCFYHLARVTSGLDSAIIAESEIQGQVKTAYETATSYIQLPLEMHYLFQKSLKIGKQVRSDIPLKPGLPDLEDAIFQTVFYFFKQQDPIRILFVGTSSINEKVLTFLQTKNCGHITICNRSLEAAEEFSSKYGVQQLQWSNLSNWHAYDCVIFGTKSTDFLIDNQNVPVNLSNEKLIVDLCVPRNVHPAVTSNPKITLLNIDQINRRLKIRKQKIVNALAKAEDLVALQAKKQIELFKKKELNRQAAHGEAFQLVSV